MICRKLGTQLESQGNYQEAIRLFERALINPDGSHVDDEKHVMQCYAGISRCSIKSGDVNRGVKIATELNDGQQIIEIAIVCENMRHMMEAGSLYEKGGLFEKAASIYISLKMFTNAAPLMSKIKSPKLLILWAKTKESEGNYQEAEHAYEKAEDWENVIRLNLNFLDDAVKAKTIFKAKSQSQGCAMMLAQYFERKSMKKEAIEYLVLAGKKEEAFMLAQSCDDMESFANALKDFPVEDELKIAQYYEGKGRWGDAALHYSKAASHSKALKLYLEAGEEYFDKAIEMVAKVKQDNLIRYLESYFMGEVSGSPMNPQYLFTFYMELGDLDKAGKLAESISIQKQEQGNYKNAHSLLFDMMQKLKAAKLPVLWGLYQRFVILHSYIIVKRLVKNQDHEEAARMLNRVCKNISQFPQHAVTILTSTVIEATRANLKAMAYQWACVLFRPEYREHIAEQHKKKIENIARKSTKEEPEEKKTLCPFCRVNSYPRSSCMTFAP
jgi:WD repeat-containing protein 19